jgi:hypothetical protein
MASAITLRGLSGLSGSGGPGGIRMGFFFMKTRCMFVLDADTLMPSGTPPSRREGARVGLSRGVLINAPARSAFGEGLRAATAVLVARARALGAAGAALGPGAGLAVATGVGPGAPVPGAGSARSTQAAATKPVKIDRT